MEELTSKQRAQLRGLANSIDTILHVGKDGIGNLKKSSLLDTARELASSMEVLGVFYEYRGGVGQGGAQAAGSWLGV